MSKQYALLFLFNNKALSWNVYEFTVGSILKCFSCLLMKAFFYNYKLFSPQKMPKG